MCKNWIRAYNKYSWTANLNNFGSSQIYMGFFESTITPTNTLLFENKFRTVVDEGNQFVVAGEVCFWKNYGNVQSRDRITQKLLAHLSNPVNWDKFTRVMKQISTYPSIQNFIALQDAINQPKGFATPITFLAFYNPTKYPMVDKHIANWWTLNKAKFGYKNSPNFSQREDGWIQTYTKQQVRQNWEAYLAWQTFCEDYAIRIENNCKIKWRARDVEMAVWEAWKNNISVETLT